ncbi:ATPase [Halopseudomonas maritima]|uniref:ATPase n=1 Tax=Halopseudomonas maritima TaxID=2918528 RepID=UPI001EEB8BFB|nr:ATPase [Halopseudomonas maritima]UJJ31050.1 ATPase [Halopseudomonas maritima]
MKEPELGELPSISAVRERPSAETKAPRSRGAENTLRAEPPPRAAVAGTGALWALCAALSLALIGLGYWTHQQQRALKQQLVSTQNSFARISEEASGRIQDITGQVSASQDSFGAAEQARQEQLKRLQDAFAALEKRQAEQQQLLEQLDQRGERRGQQLVAQQQALQALSERSEQQLADAEQRGVELAAVKNQLAEAEQGLEQVFSELAGLAALELQLGQQSERLDEQRQALASLQNQDHSAEVDQALLVLRSELDQRLGATDQALKAIDSFRLQTNRSLSTLQNQLSALHRRVEGN